MGIPLFDTPEILSAFIIGACTVLASVIAAITAAMIGRKFQNQARLKSDLREAIRDIEFLLAVEKQHGELHRQSMGKSMVRTVRTQVKQAGYSWSQRFTPGRAKDL